MGGGGTCREFGSKTWEVVKASMDPQNQWDFPSNKGGGYVETSVELLRVLRGFSSQPWNFA